MNSLNLAKIIFEIIIIFQFINFSVRMLNKGNVFFLSFSLSSTLSSPSNLKVFILACFC